MSMTIRSRILIEVSRRGLTPLSKNHKSRNKMRERKLFPTPVAWTESSQRSRTWFCFLIFFLAAQQQHSNFRSLQVSRGVLVPFQFLRQMTPLFYVHTHNFTNPASQVACREVARYRSRKSWTHRGAADALESNSNPDVIARKQPCLVVRCNRSCVDDEPSRERTLSRFFFANIRRAATWNRKRAAAKSRLHDA